MRNPFYPLLLLAAVFLFSTCTKKNDSTGGEPIKETQTASQEPLSEPVRTSHWHYFYSDRDGYLQLHAADTISEIPETEFKPWTEALRVADCSLAKETPLFLINKCGLYPLSALQSNMRMPIRHQLFAHTSAGDIYMVNGSYFIRIYQNTDFSPQQKADNTVFLLRTDSADGEYTPVADVTSLHIPKEGQCKTLEHVNGEWYAGFKADTGSEVSFFYIGSTQFDIFMQNDAFKHIEQLSPEAFRAACEPASYRQMPDIVKDLAETINTDTDLYLKLITEDSIHGVTFLKPASINTPGDQKDKIPLNGYALQYTQDGSKQNAAILLPDGTLKLNTHKDGISERRLPLLPQSYNYTAFIISGTEITAAWEETAFYAVGRTGIFTADIRELPR